MDDSVFVPVDVLIDHVLHSVISKDSRKSMKTSIRYDMNFLLGHFKKPNTSAML